MEKIEFHAMGCQVMAAIDRDEDSVKGDLQKVKGWFETWEQRFSRFRQDSELSRINQSTGQPLQVSQLMKEVLQSALQASQLSGGLVTPAILNALESAGYDRSFEQLMPVVLPAGGQLHPMMDGPVVEDGFWFDAQSRTLMLSPGVRLDLGGIAKGWAVDRAVRRLGRIGPALVDAGGDIAVSGCMADGEPWSVGVYDPYDPVKQLDLILLSGGAVATSGRDRRRWLRNGTWRHHLIDPRTRLPAQTDVLRATVIAPNARLAEAAAKTVLISGSMRGIEWMDNSPKYAGLIVLEDGGVLTSREWSRHVWR
jgi:thiamine biosynthesis lipoprotein